MKGRRGRAVVGVAGVDGLVDGGGFSRPGAGSFAAVPVARGGAGGLRIC